MQQTMVCTLILFIYRYVWKKDEVKRAIVLFRCIALYGMKFVCIGNSLSIAWISMQFYNGFKWILVHFAFNMKFWVWVLPTCWLSIELKNWAIVPCAVHCNVTFVFHSKRAWRDDIIHVTGKILPSLISDFNRILEKEIENPCNTNTQS